MKLVLIILATLVLLILVVVAVGFLLPREHQASSRVELRQSPETIWAVIRNLGEVPAFWPEIKKAVSRPARDGHEMWAQTMKNGYTMPLEIVEDEPPRRLVTRIASPPGSPFGGSWIYQIEPVAGGSRVTITEDGWIANPVFRVVSRAMGYHGTLDSYLKALGLRLGETVEPIHVIAEG